MASPVNLYAVMIYNLAGCFAAYLLHVDWMAAVIMLGYCSLACSRDVDHMKGVRALTSRDLSSGSCRALRACVPVLLATWKIRRLPRSIRQLSGTLGSLVELQRSYMKRRANTSDDSL